jgi:IS30 family transposase
VGERVSLLSEEREIISRELAKGNSARNIGKLIRRHHSVISREISRNGGRENYRAMEADDRAEQERARPKPRKLESCRRLHDEVNAGLKREWSPEQISNRLRIDFPDDPEMRVSDETIYESLYLQGRGELRTELTVALRSGRARRAPRSRIAAARGQITGMVNISERPPEATDRAIPGALEGDLIIGKGGKSQIATLVDRSTRFTVLVRIPYDRTADRVAALLAMKMETLPEFLRKSVTWDQGKEMARHANFTVKTGIPVYFCDPHSPWQRGTNENTNGLLRQYFPKGTELGLHTQMELDNVAMRLNGRPRKTLGWKTPFEAYSELLAESCGASTT